MPAEALFATTERMLARRLASEQANGRAPSLVAALARDGTPVWADGRGRVDGTRPGPDTQYRIGSITKTFTAVLVMRLRDEGRIALDDPLERHLPGTRVGDVTIAHLLAHAAGIGAETPPPWWERVPGTEHPTLADALGHDPRRFRPGRRHHYSNVGFAVLGELVARLRGTSWAEALRAELLEPLGMSRTTPLPVAPHARGFAVHPHADVLLPEPAHDSGVMAPAGQLWSTTADLLRWAEVLGGRNKTVLAADTLAEMREPAVVEDAPGRWMIGAGLGLQLIRQPSRALVGHGGSMPGFVAALWASPGGPSAVALANATSGPAVTGLAVDLIEILQTQEPELPDEWVPASDLPRELLAMTGAWYWGPVAYILSVTADGGLRLAPRDVNGRRSAFRPGPDGGWIGLDGYFAGETLSARRRPDGTVSHLDIASFVFTRVPYDPAAPVPGGVDPRGWGAP
jgi:CubicO group peptidase (beta-lactamase class C family)